MLVMALTWNACTEDVDFSPAGPAEGEQVYFSNMQNNRISISKSGSSFSVSVNRMQTAGETTVGIKASGNTTDYTVPTSVTFKAGESVASIVIAYNPANLEYDAYSKLTLQLENTDNTTPYGDSSFTFEVGIPAPYTTIGDGIYRDAFICTIYGLESLPYIVEIQKNDVKEGVYRLVSPYGKRFPYYSYGVADKSKDYYLEIDASDPECVFIPFQSLGFQLAADGIAYAYSMAAFALAQGLSKEDVKARGWAGTLKDGIITFPQDALIVNFSGSEEDTNQFYKANMNSEFLLTMPGVELTDYSIDMTYKGFMVDANNKAYALANIALGADVEYAKVAIVEQTGAKDELNQAIQGIINGTIKSTTVEESGEVQLSCKKSGVFYMIGVTFKGNEAQEAAYLRFKAAGSGDGGDEQTPIEAYEGTYMISGVYTDQNGEEKTETLPVILKHGILQTEEGDLPAVFVQGLMGFNGYTTLLPLLYDEMDGTLSMVPMFLDPFTEQQSGQQYDVIFSPVVSSAGKMFKDGDSLTGKLDSNGNLVFTNGDNNVNQYDAFIFALAVGNQAQLFSPFYELSMTAAGGAASSNAKALQTIQVPGSGIVLQRMDATPMKGSMQLVKETESACIQIPVKGCGELDKQFIPVDFSTFK